MRKLKSEKCDCSGIVDYSRISHSSVVVGTEILLAGGDGASTDSPPATLQLDCRTLRFKELPHRSLRSWGSLQMFTLGDSCYGWGGNSELLLADDDFIHYGDFYKFDDGSLEMFQQIGVIPQLRIHHKIVSVGVQHALLYGGVSNKTAFNDWYLFDIEDHSWRLCKLLGEPPQEALHLPSLCWAYDRGYLFGGQLPSQNHIPRYSRELYEVRVQNFRAAQLRFCKLPYEEGPAGRSRHASACYQGKRLFVMCGQGFSESDLAVCPYVPKMFSDLWIYNIEQGTWQKSELSIGPRVGSTAHICDEKLVVVCGARNLFQLCTDMEIIQLELTDLNQLVCGICQSTLATARAPSLSKRHEPCKRFTPELSLEFVEGMAQLIQFPFHAVGLLIDNSYNMGASQVLINLRMRNNHHYLDISDNSRCFTRKQFVDAIWKFNIKRTLELNTKDAQDVLVEAEYGLNLKIGSLRLGRCVLFISKNEQDTYVAFFSSMELYVPHTDHPILLEYYTHRTKAPLPKEHRLHRKLIIQACRNILSEDQLLLIENSYERVYKRILVFELRSWTNGQSIHYQLERDNTDVRVACRKDSQKLPLELSLKNYISHLYLRPYMGRSIYLQDHLIRPVNYDETVKRLSQQKGLRSVDVECKLQQKFHKLRLVRVHESQQCSELQGVLLYHDNRLFGVANRELGSFSSCADALHWAGVVEIPHQIQLNILKTSIENPSQRHFLQSELKKIFIQRDPSQLKRQRQHLLQDQSRILKKHNRSERI